MTELSPLLLRHLERLGQDTSSALDHITSTGRLSADSQERDLFVTALEISAEQHLRVQATF
ncbi:MAG TPA: hypothetical protein VN633_02970 [Bryobacteraceae bacterium]|nr:hypothetical protein [Bryobacteraceae bacterium]